MSAAFLRKYNTAITAGSAQSVKIPMIKRGVVDFAVGADWTPSAGDVKISKDGGAAANIATLPAAVAMGNGAYWEFVFSNTELACGTLVVTIADSATKAVEDQAFIIETFGNASAFYVWDMSLANLPANVTQLLGTAWLTPGVAGTPDVNAKQIGATAQTGRDIGASVLLSAGTGTGQLDFTSGVVKANLAQILGTALTETAGQIAAAFKKFFNIATPAATMDHLILVDTATTVTNQLTAAAVATGVWQDTTAGDFTVSASIGKSIMNGVALGTGLTVNDLTTKSGYSLSAAGITAIWQDTTAGDFTAANSIGKSIMNGVALGTGLTINGYTGNTPQTGDAYARIGANGISLSAIPDLAGVTTLLSRLSSARAGYLDNINNAALQTTVAQTGDNFARLGAPSGASVSADIAAAKVDTAAIRLVTIKLDSMITFGVGSPSDYAFNITAMENAPSGSGASAATIAAAVWDEARSGHVSGGTFGEGVVINSIANNAITAASIAANAITAAKIATDAIDADALAADAVTEMQSGLSTLTAGGVRTAVGLGSANLDTQLAAIQADTDDIQTRIPAALTGAGNMKADALAISGATESADRLERSTLAIVLGTCTTGGTTTSVVAGSLSPTSAVNDQFNGRIITFDKDTTTAALRGQATDITDYVHSSLTFTCTALTTAPSSGDTFTIT